MTTSCARHALLPLLVFVAFAAPSPAQTPPAYDVTFLGPASGVSGLSETGVVIGHRTVGGSTRGWVASAGSALQLLPLPVGDNSSWANDINEQGVIVGAVSTSTTSPEFFGRAVVWLPDTQAPSGYIVQELGELPGHSGSIATAINNLGDVVGYSMTGMFRYPVWFTSGIGVMDLNPFGVFDPQSINDQRVFCDRLGKRMDLDTMTVESLGVPAGPPSYQATLGYAINEAGHVAGTAVLVTSGSCVYQAARYVDGLGWQLLTSCSPLANASDINDRDDVIYQAQLIYQFLHLEGLGEFDVQTLLAPGSASWDVVTSFNMDINSARQLAVIATDTVSGETGAALLTPSEICQADLGYGGPGSLQLSMCGGDLSTGTTSDLSLSGGTPGGVAWMLLGLVGNAVPFSGGTLVPVPWVLVRLLPLDGAGAWQVAGVPGGGGPFSVYLQAVVPDAGLPLGYAISNALRADFLP